MNRLSTLAALSLVALATGCAAAPEEGADEGAVVDSDESELTSDGNRSDYTLLTEKNCLIKYTEGDEAPISNSYCGGRGGYSLYIFDGDDRQAVSTIYGKKTVELRNVEAVNYAFTYLGEKAEWRSSQKDPNNPFALIFRQFVSGDVLGKSTSMLVVSKLSKTGTPCIYKIIDASKHKDANQLARNASNAALKGTCPKNLPKPE